MNMHYFLAERNESNIFCHCFGINPYFFLRFCDCGLFVLMYIYIYIYLNLSILGEGSEKDPQGVEGPPERPSCFIQCWFVFTLKTVTPCEKTEEKLYPSMILFSVGWFHCYQIFIQYL